MACSFTAEFHRQKLGQHTSMFRTFHIRYVVLCFFKVLIINLCHGMINKRYCEFSFGEGGGGHSPRLSKRHSFIKNVVLSCNAYTIMLVVLRFRCNFPII